MSDETEQLEQSEDVLEDDGVLQPGDSLEGDDLSADPLDTGISPSERHPASERYGVTAAEARTGESLDARLAEEEPDVGSPVWSDSRPELEENEPPLDDEEQDPRAGRLVAYGEGAHETVDPEYYARDVGIDGGSASAEEAAMHVIGEDEAIDGTFDDEDEFQDVELGEGFAEDREEGE
jgi:hypothetical protein